VKSFPLIQYKFKGLSRAFIAGSCAFTILPSQGLAADNIHEITVGLTCANIGRETGKWDDLEGTGGFLDAPWYTGQKEGTSWQEDNANKAARIWSDIYYEKTDLLWTRFNYYSDKVSRSYTVPRHHRWGSTTPPNLFTWTHSDRSHRWGKYLGNCETIEGGIPIKTISKESILELARGINIDVENTETNNFKMALNTLPRAHTATGGRSTQEYQYQLSDVVLDSLGQFQRAYEQKQLNETKDAIEIDEKSYQSKRGVEAWIKTLSGHHSVFDYESGSAGTFGNWESNYSGYVLGVNSDLNKNLTVGGFMNRADIDTTFLDAGGGYWRPSGYGGGIYLGYQKENFVVKGLLGKTTIDGLHSRGLLAVGDFEAGLAFGDKKAEIYTGSFMTGYRLKSKFAIFEPQIFLNANKNYDYQWHEIGGGDFNLRYEKYDDFFLRSRLSVKISPLRANEKTEGISPHIRIGWLADWNTNNRDVEVQNIYNSNRASLPINQRHRNGLSIEAELSYLMKKQHSSKTSITIKGGIETWDSPKKPTNWNVSGGISITF
jgi:hypothetical protein